jgi:hypothetical protein
MIITKKRLVSGVLLLFSVIILLGVGAPVLAQNGLFDSQTGLKEIGSQAYGNASPVDVRITIAKIINLVLTFLGAIFVVLMVVAGFQYMTAGGNKEQTEKAVSLLKNAVIGLFIIIASWAITRFVIVVSDRTVRNNAVDYTSGQSY